MPGKVGAAGIRSMPSIQHIATYRVVQFDADRSQVHRALSGDGDDVVGEGFRAEE